MIRRLGFSNGALRSDRPSIPYLINMPEAPNETVQFRGWVSETCILTDVRALMSNVNTSGSYTLRLSNTTQSHDLLEATTFDMNTLVSDLITVVPIISNTEYKTFGLLDRWTLELTSDSASFDGEGIYIELVFGVI